MLSLLSRLLSAALTETASETMLWTDRQVHHYKIIVVCACMRVYKREVTGSDLTQAKSFLSRRHWTWDDTADSPLTAAGYGPAATKVSCFQKTAGQN